MPSDLDVQDASKDSRGCQLGRRFCSPVPAWDQAEPRVLGDALPPHADGQRAGASPPPLCDLGCVISRSGPQFPLPRGLMQEGFKSLLFFFNFFL